MRKSIMSFMNKTHIPAECRELKKALHELADKGQIDHFLKRGPQLLLMERKLARLEPSEEERSVEIVAIVIGRYAEGITRSTWKVQLRGAQYVLIEEQGSHVTVPTMLFDGSKGPHFTSPHNNPLVIELKMASALV